jgi:hypothetical protein
LDGVVHSTRRCDFAAPFFFAPGNAASLFSDDNRAQLLQCSAVAAAAINFPYFRNIFFSPTAIKFESPVGELHAGEAYEVR